VIRTVYLNSSEMSLPAPPSRDQAITIVTSGMQGTTIYTSQYGVLPWWDAALPWLTEPSDRRAIYTSKKQLGDTHQLIQLPWGPPLYDEPDQAYSPDRFGPLNWTGSGDERLHGLVDEVVRAGLIPVVFLGGDDGERGFPHAVEQLPDVVAKLGPLMAYTVISPFWDGGWYGWTAEHLTAFSQQFRQLGGLYLAMEFQPGRIPVGNGPPDYAWNGAMAGYDVLLQEFDFDVHQDSTWQVAGRLLGPAYVRPPDQPHGDDPSPPWYLSHGSQRGPYGVVAFEYETYLWVRNQVSVEQIQQDRAYLSALGYPAVC
jgi:hypothetical protein